jgi:transposase
MPRSRKYPLELLDRVTRLVFESGRPIAHVAADLGLPSETLRKYVRQVEANEGRRPDLPTSEEREEIRELRREVFSAPRRARLDAASMLTRGTPAATPSQGAKRPRRGRRRRELRAIGARLSISVTTLRRELRWLASLTLPILATTEEAAARSVIDRGQRFRSESSACRSSCQKAFPTS